MNQSPTQPPSAQSEPLPFPRDAGPVLRELFARPRRELADLEPEAVTAVLDLARWHGRTEEVALLTASGGPELASGLDLPGDEELVHRSDGRILVPLTVPLLPSGHGGARVFAALVLRQPAVEADLERLARHASRALIDAELRRRADRDELTGLLSRRAFERRLPATAERLVRGEAWSVFMVDVDRLRDVNAARGVDVGDELLKTVAALALGALGGEGVACRYGSDELALLAPGGQAQAGALAQQIADSIERLEGYGHPAPSVSIGYASGPEHGRELNGLVLHADQALARAKDEGGDRIVAWSPQLQVGRRQDRLAGVLTGHDARDRQHVTALLDTVREVSALGPLHSTLTRVVDRCVAVADAERGLLLLREGDEWVVHTARGPDGVDLSPDALTYARSIVEETARRGSSISRLADGGGISPSADELALAAVVCAPLQGPDVPEGVLYVDTRSRRRPYDAATVSFFDALVAQVSVALRNSVLYQQAQDRAQRLEADVSSREAELVRARQRWAFAQDQPANGPSGVPGLIGVSPAIREVLGLLDSLEGTSVPVVVRGESGTGKELISRAIHERSGRTGPLVTVNCAAIAAGLFESELFGHVRGSFTGAHTDRVGLLEAAHGGTLFMDEVGELPLDAQAKLLRALQEGEVRRLGEAEVRPIDVRVVAATNRDLQAMVAAGEFREDLYYRLAVFRIQLPPLRNRVEDIPLIASHLLEEITGFSVELDRDTTRALMRRRWPGNVRELRNTLQRAVVLAGAGPLQPSHVEAEESSFEAFSTADLLSLPLREAKTTFTVLYAREMLRRANGSFPEAAKLAGVARQTLYRILADA